MRADVPCPNKFRHEPNIRICPLATHSDIAVTRARTQLTQGTLKLPLPAISLLWTCTACQRVGGNLACRSSEELVLCRYVDGTPLLPLSKCQCACGSARTVVARAHRDWCRPNPRPSYPPVTRWGSAARPDGRAARLRRRCSHDCCRVLREKPLLVHTLSASLALLPMRVRREADRVALVEEMGEEEEAEVPASVGSAVHPEDQRYLRVGTESAVVSPATQ